MIPLNFYIVENEPLITTTIAIILKKQGYDVVGDGDEYDQSLIEIVSLRPDIVLLDIKLEGEKSGVDLALALDQLGICYLYLSSLADPITSLQIKSTHPLGFIDKPFTEFGLQNQISKLCSVA